MRFARSLFALALLGAAAPALAQSTSTLESVEAVQTPDGADVRIATDTMPSYSVFTLRNPFRIFVDLSNTTPGAVASDIAVDVDGIEQISVSGYEDALTAVTRVTVELSHDTFYDVTDEGGVITLHVELDATGPQIARGSDGSPGPAPQASDGAVAHVDAERLAELEARLTEVQAELEQRDAERRQALRESTEDEAEAQARLDALATEIATRDATIATLEEERGAALAVVAESERQSLRLSQLESALAERERELELARAQAQAANGSSNAPLDVVALRSQLEAERDAALAGAQQQRAELEQRALEAEARLAEAHAQQTSLEAELQAAEDARERAEQARQQAEDARAQAEEARLAAERARAEADAARAQAEAERDAARAQAGTEREQSQESREAEREQRDADRASGAPSPGPHSAAPDTDADAHANESVDAGPPEHAQNEHADQAHDDVNPAGRERGHAGDPGHQGQGEANDLLSEIDGDEDDLDDVPDDLPVVEVDPDQDEDNDDETSRRNNRRNDRNADRSERDNDDDDNDEEDERRCRVVRTNNFGRTTTTWGPCPR